MMLSDFAHPREAGRGCHVENTLRKRSLLLARHDILLTLRSRPLWGWLPPISMIIGAFQVRYLDLNGHATNIGGSPFVTDTVEKRFWRPARRILFSKYASVENFDSRTRPFGF